MLTAAFTYCQENAAEGDGLRRVNRELYSTQQKCFKSVNRWSRDNCI